MINYIFKLFFIEFGVVFALIINVFDCVNLRNDTLIMLAACQEIFLSFEALFIDIVFVLVHK